MNEYKFQYTETQMKIDIYQDVKRLLAMPVS